MDQVTELLRELDELSESREFQHLGMGNREAASASAIRSLRAQVETLTRELDEARVRLAESEAEVGQAFFTAKSDAAAKVAAIDALETWLRHHDECEMWHSVSGSFRIELRKTVDDCDIYVGDTLAEAITKALNEAKSK